MKVHNWYIRPFLLTLDGESEGSETQASTEELEALLNDEQKQAEHKKADQKKPARTFTQEEVNRIMKAERVKQEDKIKTLESGYSELLENQNIQGEEREKLSASYEDLKAQFRTKEQQLAEEKRQSEDAAAIRIAELEESATFWENKYTQSSIDTALQSAAVKHEAWNPGQVLTQLGPQTKMVEELDSKGKGTGNFKPMVELSVMNEETGEPEVLQMTPDEAVQQLKKVDEHKNLFRAAVREGLASTSGTADGAGNRKVDPSKLDGDQYYEMRKKNPAALGLRSSNTTLTKWDQ
jgi:hypothetical protein